MQRAQLTPACGALHLCSPQAPRAQNFTPHSLFLPFPLLGVVTTSHCCPWYWYQQLLCLRMNISSHHAGTKRVWSAPGERQRPTHHPGSNKIKNTLRCQWMKRYFAALPSIQLQPKGAKCTLQYIPNWKQLSALCFLEYIKTAAILVGNSLLSP